MRTGKQLHLLLSEEDIGNPKIYDFDANYFIGRTSKNSNIQEQRNAPKRSRTIQSILIPNEEKFRFISKWHCTLLIVSPNFRGSSFTSLSDLGYTNNQEQEQQHESSFYSSMHCLVKDGNLLDEKSTNGTWVNGKRITRDHQLKHQDAITFRVSSEYPKCIFIVLSELDNCSPEEDTCSYEYLQDTEPPSLTITQKQLTF